MARDIDDARAGRFFNTNVANWLRRQSDCLTNVIPQKGLPHWAVQSQNKNQRVQKFVLSEPARNALHRLRDCILRMLQEEPKSGHLGSEARKTLNGLHKMSVSTVLQKAEFWQAIETNREFARPQRSPRGYLTVPLHTIKLKHGFVWEKLSSSDLVYLGFDLMNCLRRGHYARGVNLRSVSIWGLRHPQTHRFVAAISISTSNNAVLSCRSKRNTLAFEWGAQVLQLVEQLDLNVSESSDIQVLLTHARRS